MESFGDKFKQLAKKLRNHHRNEVPHGCFPVYVLGEGLDAEAEVIRYVVPVEILKSACFKRLLDEYEEEIQMHTGHPITLPCSVHKFEEALSRSNRFNNDQELTITQTYR